MAHKSYGSLQPEGLHENISASFKRVRNAFDEQQKLIERLEKRQAFLESSVSENNKRITGWISHFEEALGRLIAEVSALDLPANSPQTGQAPDLTPVKAELSHSLDLALATQLKELEAFKQALKQELVVFAAQPKLKAAAVQAGDPPEPVINVNNANNVNPITPEPHYNAYNGLSNPEKWLMGVLFNAEAPLSYLQLAERTGKSVSTARVYMNQLKTKGFVEESSLPNGIKIFSLKHDAKVKKLYNI